MKKKVISLILALVPIILLADPVEIDGVYYNLYLQSKTANVTRKSDMRYEGNVVIPEIVSYGGNDYNVKVIEMSAFSNCYNLTSISLPNSVTIIEPNAFNSCNGLKNIVLPYNLESIGESAFLGCSGLTNISIPNSVKSIGKSAFLGCTGLSTINIPMGLTIIEASTFSNCWNLNNIIIPNSVTTIEEGAFSGCNGLSSITIPNSVVSIGGDALGWCYNLTDVFCYAEEVPQTGSDVFHGAYIEYATLHVPASAINKYKTTEPWKNFKNIVSLENEAPTLPKCENPTISYENGELKMTCATEGVEFVTDITDADIKKHYDAEIKLSATYNISVYATKAGYDISDVVHATLCWIDAAPKTEGITNGVTNVNARAVLIQNNGGIITVNGVDDGMRVNAYSLNGVEEASAISRNGAAVLNTNAQTGSTVIINLGTKAVKVLMK